MKADILNMSRMIENPETNLAFCFKFFFRILGRKIFLTFILFSFVALFEGVGFIAFIPLLSGELPEIFDIPILNDLKANSTLSVILILCMFIVKAFITFVALWRLSHFTGQIYYSIKTDMFKNALNAEYLVFSRRDTGYYINLINDQTTRALNAFHHLNQAMISLVQGIILVSIGFLTAWGYSIFLIASAAFILFLFGFLNRYVSLWSDDYSARSAVVSQKCIEYIGSWKYFVATGKIESAVQDINLLSKKLIRVFLKMTIAGHFTASLREPFAVLIVAILLIYEIKFGDGSIASILVSLAFFYRAMNNFLSFQQSKQGVLDSIGALRLLENEAEQLKTGRLHSGICQPQTPFLIEFRNVTFNYTEEKKVLDNTSFAIEPGKINSIIGPSGAGKTTIAGLLTGLLEPANGEILVNGSEIRRVDVKEWRKKIGYLTQDPMIKQGSVLDNICMAEHSLEKEDAEKARSAINAVGLAKFVEALPEKMDTYIGSQGFNLSGGQKQRIAIAREIYKNVDILILDEPSSALDSNSEQLLIDTLLSLCSSNVTIVNITHSKAILEASDNIIQIHPTND